MKNFLKKLSLLLIPVMIFVFLFLEAGESKAATSTPSPVMSSTTIVVGDHINIKVSNSDADHVSNDIPVSFVGVKEGVAKVTACRQATNCASINITVIKKAARRLKVVKVVKNKVTKAKRIIRPVKKAPAKVVYAPIAAQESGVQIQSLILSQTNLQVREKESTDIFVQNTNAVTAVSDSSVVSAAVTSNPSLNNVKITFYGIATGVANVKICNQSMSCATVRVTVVSSVADSALVLSQANVSVRSQESTDIYVQNRTAITAISSDYSVANTAVNGNPALNNVRVTIYGVGPGTATIKICDQSQVCTTIPVVVTAAYQVVTSPSATVTSQSVVNNSVIGERYLRIPPGTTYWMNMGSIPNLSVVSDIWLVPARVKNNYLVITVTSYFEGEANLNVCSGSSPSDCGIFHVNANLIPPNATVYGPANQ